MANRKEIHDRVLNATSREELATVYGEWAEHYDKDLIDEMGYVAPVIASQLLQGYVSDLNARILGCRLWDRACRGRSVSKRLSQP
ncbi:MAG: hypothetical protein PF441_05405 [Desulfuromusa sp.]|jgi:predicted TPR repeat methyltransferase|nr:hypothetical protein [Desulfuromusa sp.]